MTSDSHNTTDIMNLCKILSELPQKSIILIGGFGGSGKSTLAQRLQKQLPSTIISVDDFYTEQEEYHNWDCYEYDRLIDDVFVPFQKGLTNRYVAYNWHNPAKPLTKELDIAPYLIVEGVGLFRSKVLTHTDYSIWIDVPLDTAVQAGKQRDQQLYHVNNHHLWEGIWKRNDQEHFVNQDPLNVADYIYRRDRSNSTRK